MQPMIPLQVTQKKNSAGSWRREETKACFFLFVPPNIKRSNTPRRTASHELQRFLWNPCQLPYLYSTFYFGKQRLPCGSKCFQYFFIFSTISSYSEPLFVTFRAKYVCSVYISSLSSCGPQTLKASEVT